MRYMRMISFIFQATRIYMLPSETKLRNDLTSTEEVGVYLGNRIVIASGKFAASKDQAEYTEQILEKFGMTKSHAVATPMVSRLSTLDRGEELSTQDKSQYRVKVGSLLYLACWTRPISRLQSPNYLVLSRTLSQCICKDCKLPNES